MCHLACVAVAFRVHLLTISRMRRRRLQSAVVPNRVASPTACSAGVGIRTPLPLVRVLPQSSVVLGVSHVVSHACVHSCSSTRIRVKRDIPRGVLTESGSSLPPRLGPGLSGCGSRGRGLPSSQAMHERDARGGEQHRTLQGRGLSCPHHSRAPQHRRRERPTM